MALDSRYAKSINDTKPGESGSRFAEGENEYILLVKRICLHEGKHKGTFLIPEFEVLESEHAGEGANPNRTGDAVSTPWALNESGNKGEAMKGNAKKFFAALLNVPIDGDVMGKASSFVDVPGKEDSERARGMVVGCRTVRGTIQTGPNAGKVAYFPRFSTIPQTSEEIKKRKADLDARKK